MKKEKLYTMNICPDGAHYKNYLENVERYNLADNTVKFYGRQETKLANKIEVEA